MIEKIIKEKDSGNCHANRSVEYTKVNMEYQEKVYSWFNEILKMRNTNVRAQ